MVSSIIHLVHVQCTHTAPYDTTHIQNLHIYKLNVLTIDTRYLLYKISTTLYIILPG